ncbi:EAL domain-containing protein [Thiomicrorhabdus sediminis]|uniref:EAL domain-containing protein n=1 Tax=Thiomicrorhabdus sediminis TaxID=2580412 RepID=A0A4P9K5D0_9GAMM|nr:EAL domain-containing protein [Thiomicrorhabdus sediminis]QCU90224.1 EAL domain-containing protein [Thiomicrorhabdus sediminis]
MNIVEFGDKQLFSAFQPIYSFPNQACIGVEALIRGVNKSTQEPLNVYDCLQAPEGLSKTEFIRAINSLHLQNWNDLKTDDIWIFINLDFDSVDKMEDLCLDTIVKKLKVNGRHIVVEVVENEIKDEKLFEELIYRIRKMGCMIALDDFGAGHSNVDRIWKAQPDIVKLDRQVLLEASKSVRSQSILRNLTRLIQQSGSIALLEGIETKEQALLAMDVGVDLVQGFYFAKPEFSFEHVTQGERRLVDITNHYPAYLDERQFVETIQRKGYEALFEPLYQLSNEAHLEQEMLQISNMSFVKRFFILDEEGYQVSEEYALDNADVENTVLKQGKGLCWKNRRYFVKAMENTSRIWVSSPYRSLIDVELCLTVTRVIETTDSKRYVACYDVYYHDKSTQTVQISV